MPEPISTDDVAHIARLANLSLSADELERFTAQLGDVLEHAQDMAALDLDGVEPTAHPYPMGNVLRDDVAAEPLNRDDVLSAAPVVEGNMFQVPPVMGADQ